MSAARQACTIFALSLTGLLTAEALHGQQYQLTLPLDSTFGPTVEAVVDLARVFGTVAGPQNPYVYDCVAFVQVVRQGESTGVPLQRTGPNAWRREVIWVGLAGDAPRRHRPSLVGVTGPQKETFVVALDPENSQAQYVISIDSAEVIDSGRTHMARNLATTPFAIPATDFGRCGHVPEFETNVLAPDGMHPGWGVDFDMVLRRGVQIGGGGLVQLTSRGGVTTSDQNLLANAVSANARFDVKLTPGWQHWVSVGAVEGLEATERFDVMDIVQGATAHVRLDFLPLTPLRRLVRRFTPYPMLTLQYNFVDRVKGEGEPAVAGRPVHEHRLRAGVDWTIPAITQTTIRAKVQADYLLSDVPAGQRRLRTWQDMSIEYPLNSANDVALVVEWLNGRAAPAYALVSRWLTGIGIRR
jgi:hypothetical protein